METQNISQSDSPYIMVGSKDAKNHTMADGRLPAFLGLAKSTGGVYAEDQKGVSVDQALHAAGLDFRVDLVEGVEVPIAGPSGVSLVKFPKHRGTVRVNPDGSMSGLGIVKTKYRPCQNIEAGQYAQAVIDEGGANVVAVGAYGDPIGAKTYMALRLPETMLVGGQDRFDLFMTVTNDHTGGGGLTATLAPIRFDCTNQTTGVFGRKAPMRYSIRHSGDMRGKAIEARRVLDLSHQWIPLFQEAAERMLDQAVSDAQFEEIVKGLLPEPTGTTVRSLNSYQTKVDGLLAARQSDSNAFGRDTAYGAYNGIVEWADFYQPVNNEHLGTARYARIMAGGMDKIKEDAFTAFLELSTV
jgi:phage/plasmid-like protein (TIGR03299 family)